MINKILAPVAKKVPFEMEIHGHKRVDDYYWMRDDKRKDLEILAQLEAENDYLKAKMKHTEGFQKILYDEIVGRVQKDDSSVPINIRGYWYQSKFDGDVEYPVYIRWKDGQKKSELLFNVNEMAEGNGYFDLSGYTVSNNNILIAFGTDTVSRRLYTLEFKNLETGNFYPDKLINTDGAAIWASDNEHVFYIKKDVQTLLGQEVYRHKLGTDQSQDILVYRENDDTFYTTLSKSRDGSVIFIHHNSTAKSGVSILKDSVDCYKSALACDPISAFGGIVSCNFKINKKLALELNKLFFEVLIGNNFDLDALKILKKKKNLRLIDASDFVFSEVFKFSSANENILLQSEDKKKFIKDDFKIVSKKKPSKMQFDNLIFAFNVCRYVKSNAIVLASNKTTAGIGSGQPSRLDSCQIAIDKMRKFSTLSTDIVAASDAFFPFIDGIEKLVQAGIKAIIQPSGSIRDKKVIKFANETDTVLIFSKTRHFRH